jgi:hypothetical protein
MTRFSWFSSFPSGKFWDSRRTLSRDRFLPDSFQFIFHYRIIQPYTVWVAGHSGRAVWVLAGWLLGSWVRSRHGCLSASFCVVLSCVGRGLATRQVKYEKQSNLKVGVVIPWSIPHHTLLHMIQLWKVAMFTHCYVNKIPSHRLNLNTEKQNGRISMFWCRS